MLCLGCNHSHDPMGAGRYPGLWSSVRCAVPLPICIGRMLPLHRLDVFPPLQLFGYSSLGLRPSAPFPPCSGFYCLGGGNPLHFSGREPRWAFFSSRPKICPKASSGPPGSALPNNLVKPPLEPSAEGADDVCGGPPRCGGGRVWEAAAVCCRSTPSFLPSINFRRYSIGTVNMYSCMCVCVICECTLPNQ